MVRDHQPTPPPEQPSFGSTAWRQASFYRDSGELPATLATIARKNMKFWDNTLAELQLQMTKATFNTWLRDSRATAVTGDGTLTIQVRSDFAKDWLENRLYDTILRTCRTMAEAEGIQVSALKFVVVSGTPKQPKLNQDTEQEEVQTAVAAQLFFPGFEPFTSNFVQTPKQFFEVVLRDGPYVMRVFVGFVIANTYGNIINYRTMQRAEWWEVNRPEIARATGVDSLRSVDRAIREARARGYVIRGQGIRHFKYRPRQENEPIDEP